MNHARMKSLAATSQGNRTTKTWISNADAARLFIYISKFEKYITPLWNTPYSFAMNTPENNHVRMTDILTCLRCNRMIAFRQALIQCVHCGFVAWYRAESATGTISYKQTPPTRPGTDILDYSLSHLQTQAVNDLASYPKPSCIMSDSQMKPMMIMLMFKVNDQTS